MDYIIREFKLNDRHEAQLLADMWNASDKGWPGGWTRGITDTADQVLDRKKQMNCLAIYVAEYDGKIVGYGDLEAQPGQKNVAYLHLLNVQPEHQEKSVGRRIVQAILNKTIEFGYKELTIGTWPGNTKSVPLYKKTGFFWVPETDVFMQNHIPTILKLPIAKDFFDKHYWYECFKHELNMEPDEIEWNGIKVFPYHFEADGDSMKFIVDSKAESITAIETNDLSISCVVGEEEIPVGIEHPVRWEIENKRNDQLLNVTLIAEGEEGIALSVLENITVEKKAVIEKSFSVAPDIKPKKRGEPAHKIRSTVMINSEPVLLESAVRPVQPVNIEFSGQKFILGKDEKVTVNLRNHLSFPVSGKLSIDLRPEVKFDRLSADFSIDAKSWTSCEFWAKIDEPGSFKTQMKATGTGERDGRIIDFSTKSTDVFFRAAPFGKIVTTVDDERKRINLESDSTSVQIDLNGGWVDIRDNIYGRKYYGQGMPELGPPFVEWRDVPPTYDYRLVEKDGTVEVTLIAPSDRFTGVVVERKMTFSGSPVIRIDSRVINNTASPQKFKLKIGGHTDIWEKLTLPTKNGLLHQVCGGWGTFPEGETDISKKPEDYTETWFASEKDGLVVGRIWHDCEEHEIFRWHSNQFDLPESPPQSYIDLEPLYIIAGHGNWEMVRKYWQWLRQPSDVREDRRPVAHPVLEAGFENDPLLVTSEKTKAKVVVKNNRGKKLNGKLELNFADRETSNASRHEFTNNSEGENPYCRLLLPKNSFDLSGIDRENPFEKELDLEFYNLDPRAESVQFSVETDIKTDRFDSSIIILGEGSEPKSTENGKIFSIDNDVLKFKIDPEFLGSIHSLEWKGNEQLLSAYPKAREFIWMNPWYGGIHPCFNWFGDARFVKEKFKGERISRVGKRGIKWYGYKVYCDLEHKDRRWLRYEAEYLTIGGSNLIAIVIRCINRTDAHKGLDSGIATWLNPGGSVEDCVVHYFQDEPVYGQAASTDECKLRHLQQRRGEYHFELHSKKWAAVENLTNNTVIALISSRQSAGVDIEDSGRDGAHIFAGAWLGLKPDEAKEYVTWLVLCESIEQAQKYAALSEVWELP